MLVFRTIFWHEAIEDILHIYTHIRACILIDAQATTRVLADLSIPVNRGSGVSQRGNYLACHQMEASRLGGKSSLYLLNHNNFINYPNFKVQIYKICLDKPVEHEKLEVIVRAGINAPSGMNRQPWVVRVVEDQKLIADVTEVYKQANAEQVNRDPSFKNMFRNAPNLICVCTPANGGDGLGGRG